MKNTFLKKAGAVALAAVMAVTFAPVASLNVFAGALNGVDSDNKVLDSTDGLVVTDGAWALTGSGITTVTAAGCKITLTLNGNDVDDLYVISGATVTIKDGVDAHGKNVKATVKNLHIGNGAGDKQYGAVTVNGDKLTISEIDGVKNAKNSLDFKSVEKVDGTEKNLQTLFSGNSASLKFEAGSYKFNPAQKFTTATGSVKDTIGSLPVAMVGGTYYYVSNDSVDAAEKAATGANAGDVVAYNGAVKVKALKSGYTAIVDVDKANAGTTLTAAADEKTSLVTMKTTYKYTFLLSDNATYGTTSYVDTMYAAGKKGLANLGEGKAYEVISGANIKTYNKPLRRINTTGVSRGNKTVYKIVADIYDRAVTLTQNDSDKFDAETAVIPYRDTNNYQADGTKAGVPSGTVGITYFTADYSALAPANSGIAVIDGSKYIINTNVSQLFPATYSAAKSIAVKTGTSLNTGKVADAIDYVHVNDGVAVSGPEDESVVEWTYNEIGTKKTESTTSAWIFGVNQDEQFFNKDFRDTLTYSNHALSYKLTVPQVAKDHVACVVAFNDSEVDTGSKYTYFKNQIASSDLGAGLAHFYFGTTADAKDGLASVLSGITTKDQSISFYATAQAGDRVYVAKDIKGTFKGVNSGVEVTGEVSQDSTKQNDGNVTWIINEGYATESVPAYRMYRKSGEHVYTISAAERDMLVSAGWINEGVAFNVNSVASKKGTPVYRVYNKNNGGMHFYTASAAEKDMLLANGWTEGAVVFYGADKATGIPVYRTYNTGSNNGEHNYTTNIAESDMNVKVGWRAEGVAFYVFK